MERLLAFGRKALFYAKVLSGYEERRIRSVRLRLNKQILQAEERKAALRRLPEQTILAEVRRMVEEMQTLNKKLEETEAAIEDYFKPLDKEAEKLMDIQLKSEEKSMKEMVKVMQQQALIEQAAAQEKMAEASGEEATLPNKANTSIPSKEKTSTPDGI